MLCSLHSSLNDKNSLISLRVLPFWSFLHFKTDQNTASSGQHVVWVLKTVLVAWNKLYTAETVTVVVTHKRFSRKWQSRSEVTPIWSWGSHQTVHTTRTQHSASEASSNILCAGANLLMREPQLQTDVTSLLVSHFRGNLLWITTTVTVFCCVELASSH